MSINKQLLDPLGTLCKLVGLNFCVLNTKIAIHNHILSLDPPNNLQYPMRRLLRDTKENISDIFYVISRIIKWYLVPDNNNNINDCEYENWFKISQSPELKKIVRYTCMALKKLQQTYEYGNVILAIQYYINILNDALEDKYDDSKLPRLVIEKELDYENLLDYDKIKNFWDIKKLKRICDLYDQCFNTFNDLEIEQNQKDALFAGYLKSINSILYLSDIEFQQLIQNSNNG